MVAIVAGNGLGLFNTSLNSLGGSGVGGQGNLGQAGGQALVNVSNGNLVLRFTDEQLSGLGQDLLQTRTYNTQGGLNDGDADGWRWDGERNLVLTGTVNTVGSQVTRTTGDGHQTVYQWNGSRYQSTEGDGAHDTVVWDAGAAQMVWTDGSRRIVERYDSNGRLLSTTDAIGTQISYGYDANGRLSSVEDSSGQALVLNYNAAGKLERVDTRSVAGGALTQQVYYGYDAQGRLINVSTDLSPEDNSIADGNVYRTDYTYDGTSFRIASVEQSDGTSASFTYQLLDGEYRVQTVTDGSGTTTFSFDLANNRTDVLNGLGQQWSYFYDADDRLIEVQTPAVNGQRLSTRYAYDLDGNVISVTDGRGNTITYQYDANGNVLLERDATGTTVARNYSADNQLLNEIRYSSTEPSTGTAQVTRLAYDSDSRVRFMVDGRGQVTEYRYNAAGLKIQEISYGDALFALTGLAPEAELTEAQLMAWADARDKTRSTLTELSYDYRGNLSRKVTYGAVNAAGVGTQESSTSVTEYIYSQHGQLLQTLVARGMDRSQKTILSSIVYDGLGRVISQTDSAGTRTTAYNGTNRTVAVTNGSGMTLTQTYDSKGQLLSLTQTAAGQTPRSTSYVYDAAGRQVMAQDATGARSYTFYDEAGRVSALVDGVGAVIEYSYNAAGQRVQEKRYATLVDTSTWYNGTPVVGDLNPVTNSADRLTTFSYDNAGRLSTRTDAIGTLTTFTYDGQGRLIQQQTGDRTTRFFYDASGHQSGQLDAEGYLRENRYDTTGRLIQSIRYASQTLAANRASGTLDQLRQPSVDDLSSWYFYDTAGRQIGSVDEKQFVTEAVYDEAGNTQQTTRYGTAYTAAIFDTTAFVTIKNTVATGTAQTTTTIFDEQGRVAQRVATDGTITAYEYDSAGRLVRETQAQGTTDERSVRTRYDAFGQTIGKLLGEASARITTGMSDTEVAAIYAQYGLTYQYDAVGRVASASDALGNRTLSYYDAAGRLTHVVNALGEVSETVYSAFGDVRERTAFTGRLADTDTAALSGGVLNAQLKNLVQAIRNAISDNRRTYDYDTRGLLTSTTDALGYVTRYGYNVFGNQTSITRTLSVGNTVVSSATYNKRDEQIGRIEDVGGLQRSSSTVYDAFGRVMSQTDGMGLTSTTSYTSNGRVITFKNPLNQSQTSAYDAFGRVFKQTDALGNTTTYAYDDTARSLTVTTPDGVSVVTVKDRHGQTLTVTDGMGAVTRYSYNKDGQIVTSQDGLNRVTKNAYDAVGRLITVTDALGRITRYGYDAANRVLTRTDANNSVTRYSFDGQGRQVRVVDAEGMAEQRITDYAYDRKGQQLRVTQEPNGLQLTTSYSYDGVGQQVQVARGTVASPNQQITLYEFDKLGRRISERQDPTGLNLTTQYRYNGNDQVTRKIDPAGNSTWYVYDAAGRLTSTVDALGYVSENRYDANGRVIETVRYAQPVQMPTVGSIDGRTLTLSGNTGRLTSVEKIPIDPAKTYTVRVRLRQVTGEGFVYAGVMTYDSTGKWLSNPYSGSYAYSAVGGVKLTPEMGWRTFEGTISGTNPINANASPNKFFEGSVGALPLLLYNYGADGSGDGSRLVEVDSLELVDNATGQALNVNANTGTDQANWYSAGLVGANSPSDTLSAERLQTLLRRDSTDRRTQFVYDAMGRQRYVIDAQGAVTENKYDANGRLTTTVQYANGILVPTDGSSDGRTLTLNGNARALTAMGKVAIDPAKTYTVRIKMRQVTGEGLVYAGVVTFDSAGNALTNPYSGTYSYSAVGGVKLTPEMGWRIFEGIISGTNPINASANPNKFFEGSASAVPLLLYNYGADSSGDPSRQVEVDSLELIDTATGQVLNINASANAGRTNWSVAGFVGANSAGDTLSAEQLQTLLRPTSNDRTTTYTYDAAGQQKTVTDAAGKIESYTYDAVGNRLTLTNKNGAVWNYRYDNLNRLVLEIAPAISVASMDADGAVTTKTALPITVITYDALGNISTRTVGRLRSSLDAAASTDDLSQARTTRYAYDAVGHQVLITSPGWYNKTTGAFQQASDGTASIFQITTEVTYDALGNAVRNRVRINNTGVAATDFVDSYKVYDSLGRLTHDIDALKGVTAYTYDAQGNRLTTRRYVNALTLAVPATGYYTGANLTATTLVANATQDRTLATRYDALGRKVSVQQDQISLYNFTGVVSTSTLITAAPTTLYSYDAFGQLVRETQVARNASGATVMTGASSVHYYDQVGNRIGSVDALGNYTRMEYDAQGKLSRQVEYAKALTVWNENNIPSAPVASANDRSTRYDYDAMGRLSQVTQEGVRYWQQTINATNGVVSATAVVGNLVVSRLTYDGVGNTRTVTDAAGNVTTTDYNALGQVSQVTEPARVTAKNGAVDPFASAVVLASPVTTYAVNAFGQVLSETRTAGRAGDIVQAGLTQTTRTRYDASGYEVQSYDASGVATNYKVDVAGRRTEQSLKTSVVLSGWTVGGSALVRNQTLRRSYVYDALGQQLSTTDWYTAADNTQKSTTNSVLYNRFGEVTSQLLNGNLQAGYAYDQAGRVIQQQNAQGIAKVDYDLNGKATRSNQIGNAAIATDDRITYTRYDNLGRALEQHLPAFEANLNADTLNNITLTLATPIIRQTYDRWGNMLSRTDARGYVTTYTYDHNNKQLTETLPVTDILRENGTSYRASLIHEKRYDGLGQLIQEADLVGPYAGVATSTELRTRQHVYNQAGELISDVDALGYSRNYRVDSNGNRVATQDALGTVLVDGYDAMDRQLSHGIIRNGAAVTLLTNQYDQAGRLVGEISGSTAVEETLYSASGSGVMTGVAGNVRYTLFDERGNIVKTRNESKTEKLYEFNEANRKVSENDALSNLLTWTYSEADFGRLVSSTTRFRPRSTYTYNGFGQIAQETLSGPVEIKPGVFFELAGGGTYYIYDYYTNGLSKSLVLTGESLKAGDTYLERSTYQYNLSGARVREVNYKRVKDTMVVVVDLTVSMESRYQLDEQSRLKEVKAPAGSSALSGLVSAVGSARLDSLKYYFDELGNRRRSFLDATSQAGVRTQIDNWYKFDREGRVLVDEGYSSGSGVAAGVVGGKTKGTAITYDVVGRRLTTEQWTSSVVGVSELYKRKSYSYNDSGQVLSSSGFDVKRAVGADSSQGVQSQTVAELEVVNVYDAFGNRTVQSIYSSGVVSSSSNYAYRGDGQMTMQRLYKVSAGVQKISQANYFGESGMFDVVGNQILSRYAVYNADGVGIKYTGKYEKEYSFINGSYKEGGITASSSLPGSPGITTFGYDRFGVVQSISVGSGIRRFNANREGQVIVRAEANNKAQTYFYYEGKALANVGTAGVAELSDTLVPISDVYPARTSNGYIVNQGDTLESIAQAVWGDSGMWYLIADANGLSSSAALVPGSTVRIPNVVGSTHNNSTTFKPYSADEIVGDNTPSPIPPPPPKPKKKKSGGLASIVMVVVAVVATVLTAGAAAPLVGVAASGGLLATGVGVLTGTIAGAGLGTLGVAFVAGAVGSAASQLAGKAMGVVDGFSWKQVAVGGLTAGATSGLGTLAQTGAIGAWASTAAEAMKSGGAYGTGYAALGTFNYASNQIASRIVGLDTAFSWRDVAASAAGATVAGYVGGGGQGLLNSVVRGQVSAYASAAIKDKWFGGGRPDYGQVAADAFGNTLGNFLVDQLRQPSAETLRRAIELAGVSPDDEVLVESVRQTLVNGATPEQTGTIFNDPKLKSQLHHPTKGGENGSYLRYEGDGVWVGVPAAQEPITYSVDNVEGVSYLNGNSTWVDWANNVTPPVHEGLIGIASFAKAHEDATTLISYAAQAVSYAMMGWVAAARVIANEAILGAAKSQVRDYAIEKVGDYYQSKGVLADNADILATGTVFGVETIGGSVMDAVNGAKRYAMQMSGRSVNSIGASRPGGYLTNDVDNHGLLSPQVNRAPGYMNNREDGYVQSHHPVQDRWAQENVPGYDRNEAPAILLESASGSPHAKISAAQRALRFEMKSNGVGPWSNGIKQEFQIGYKQMIDAGVPEGVVRKSINDSYKYFDGLGAFK